LSERKYAVPRFLPGKNSDANISSRVSCRGSKFPASGNTSCKRDSVRLPLVGPDFTNMASQSEAIKVPGHNTAVYDLVPKEEQVYRIRNLEIAPTPIETYDIQSLSSSL
jgi:hypothetical protein